ncbi:MAG: metal-sensing transcriptional repressor [Ruminococcaceae bacterium]|nr:metal-sensing transcriptional repressor [Oscillospiraceae bacterium]
MLMAHVHSHYSKALDNRLASVEGMIAAIRRMMEEGRDCEEILLQLSAAENSIKKVAKIILKDHFNTCVRESIESGDEGAVESFNAILDKYI